MDTRELILPERIDLSNPDIHNLRMTVFKAYFKTEIQGISHYLKLINFSIFDFVLLIFRLKSLPRKLYRFVVK
jgi:hypothetical protein